MKKNQLLSLKTPGLKQRIPHKSPLASHRGAPTIQNTSLDNICKTEREHIDLKIPGLSIVTPKVVPGDEESMEILIKATDKASDALRSGNNHLALQVLQEVEKDLELEASEGKILDRNLIITCLYNTACVYQAMWALEDCLKYIDAVIYNLKESLEQEHPQSPKNKMGSPKKNMVVMDPEATAAKLRKQNLLLKVYLQQSAILSHLEKHKEAYSRARDAQDLMESIIRGLDAGCSSLRIDGSSASKNSNKDQLNCSYVSPRTTLTSSRNREAYTFFKDEISYTKGLLDYAEPFVKDFSKEVAALSQITTTEALKRANKSMSTWKAHVEGKQKATNRKGLQKNGLLFPNEQKNENTRSLLGVQLTSNWLESFNIDSIIQMTPLKYREYAQKKDIANYISQDSLQEKAIYQSVIFFMIGTEMRFLDSSETLEKEQITSSRAHLTLAIESPTAETYHLKAIDIVCRYITGPCAYIDHITARYYKHYGQDLKVKQQEAPVVVVQADQEALPSAEPNHVPDQRKTLPAFQKPNLTISSKAMEGSLATIRHNDRSPRHLDQPIIVDCAPATNSLANRLASRIAEENKGLKKVLGMKLRKTGDECITSPAGRVPVIKLSPKLGDIDLEDSQITSVDCLLGLSKNKSPSPRANPVTPSSQASTSLSPKRLQRDDKKNDKEKGKEEEKIIVEKIHFDPKKFMNMPSLKLHRLDKDGKNIQAVNRSTIKPPTTIENGFISERSMQGLESARNKSSESHRLMAKIQGTKTQKKLARPETAKFDMYKEMKRFVNPAFQNKEPSATLKKRLETMPDDDCLKASRGVVSFSREHASAVKKDNTTTLKKRMETMPDEDGLKSCRGITSFSREHILAAKKDNSLNLKSGLLATQAKYLKTRESTGQNKFKTVKLDKGMAKENRNNKSGLKYRNAEQSLEDVGVISLESVEEFNNSNM